jgi:hypothetical protein
LQAVAAVRRCLSCQFPFQEDKALEISSENK